MNADGRLDATERAAAREAARTERSGREGRGPGRSRGEPPQPGRRVARDEAVAHPGIDLYDTSVLRTIFLDFESDDWESELADFYNTDVEVPATITVDGESIEGVGVHFRGASSYFGVPAGWKHSLNVAIDHTDPSADLFGYRTLNLLNANGDPSLMSTVLYSSIAGKHLPTPRANFVRVVVNGEYWGVYTNVEQANKDFLKRSFGSSTGDRWKVKGRPGGRGGLEYFGDDVASYRGIYEIKTKDTPEAWGRLIRLCKTLAETPDDRLESALQPMLDIEGVLWFLAIDNVLANSDGYWTRASDYTLFADKAGVFHLIPHDMNEAFSSGHGGPGGRRGGRGGFPMGGPLPAFDENGDGRVERDEIKRTAERFVATIAVDEDGAFGPDAFAIALQAAVPPPPGFGPPPDAGGRGEGRRRTEGPIRMMAGPLFAAVDADKHGRLNRATFVAQAVTAAMAADANSDGALDDTEVAGAMEKLMPPGGPGGPGGRGGPGGGGPTLDPMVGLDDPAKPLRRRLLALPHLRDRYLDHMKTIARNDLDWATVGPVIAGWRALILDAVREDTRKLDSTDAFEAATASEGPSPDAKPMLRGFLDRRRAYVMEYTPPTQPSPKPVGP